MARDNVRDTDAAVGAVAVWPVDDQVVVVLSGEVDVAMAARLEYAGRDAIDCARPISVDVSEVTFMDSVGLTLLVRLAAAEMAVGRRVQVHGARTGVRTLLSFSGLTDVMDLVPWPKTRATT